MLAPRAATQEKPDAPKPKPCAERSHRVFYAGISLLAAAETADAISTRRVLDAGGHENNSLLLGRRPSPARQAAVTAGLFAAQVVIFRLTERNRHAWVRWTGRAVLGGEIAVHSQLAACSASLSPKKRCPTL